MIRMIVTDLDGTLLAGKNNIPEENIRALRRAMDAGVQVVIASGRMIEGTVPIAEKIGTNAPLSLFNGAMAYDWRNDRILSGNPIPMDVARRLLEALEARNKYAQAFPGHGYFAEKHTAWTDVYAGKINVPANIVGEKLSRWLTSDVYKMLCLDEPEALDALVAELGPQFPEVTFVKSSPTYLEIIARGVDKASGLAEISRLTGIAPEEMIAFGDERNDLPMLKFVGTGYAMENAVPDVKSEMRLIAPKNTEGGVARIVNMYLDEGRMGGKA